MNYSFTFELVLRREHFLACLSERRSALWSKACQHRQFLCPCGHTMGKDVSASLSMSSRFASEVFLGQLRWLAAPPSITQQMSGERSFQVLSHCYQLLCIGLASTLGANCIVFSYRRTFASAMSVQYDCLCEQRPLWPLCMEKLLAKA